MRPQCRLKEVGGRPRVTQWRMSGLHPLVSHETRRTLTQLEGCFFWSKSFSAGEAKRVLYVTANSMRRLEDVTLNLGPRSNHKFLFEALSSRGNRIILPIEEEKISLSLFPCKYLLFATGSRKSGEQAEMREAANTSCRGRQKFRGTEAGAERD